MTPPGLLACFLSASKSRARYDAFHNRFRESHSASDIRKRAGPIKDAGSAGRWPVECLSAPRASPSAGSVSSQPLVLQYSFTAVHLWLAAVSLAGVSRTVAATKDSIRGRLEVQSLLKRYAAAKANLRDGKLAGNIKHTLKGRCQQLEFSPDGSTLLCAVKTKTSGSLLCASKVYTGEVASVKMPHGTDVSFAWLDDQEARFIYAYDGYQELVIGTVKVSDLPVQLAQGVTKVFSFPDPHCIGTHSLSPSGAHAWVRTIDGNNPKFTEWMWIVALDSRTSCFQQQGKGLPSQPVWNSTGTQLVLNCSTVTDENLWQMRLLDIHTCSLSNLAPQSNDYEAASWAGARIFGKQYGDSTELIAVGEGEALHNLPSEHVFGPNGEVERHPITRDPCPDGSMAVTELQAGAGFGIYDFDHSNLIAKFNDVRPEAGSYTLIEPITWAPDSRYLACFIRGYKSECEAMPDLEIYKADQTLAAVASAEQTEGCCWDDASRVLPHISIAEQVFSGLPTHDKRGRLIKRDPLRHAHGSILKWSPDYCSIAYVVRDELRVFHFAS